MSTDRVNRRPPTDAPNNSNANYIPTNNRRQTPPPRPPSSSSSMIHPGGAPPTSSYNNPHCKRTDTMTSSSSNFEARRHLHQGPTAGSSSTRQMTAPHHSSNQPNYDIELAINERRPNIYEDDRRSFIDRGRGSQRSRVSARSRGSYGSSPQYSGAPKPLYAKVKSCCRQTIAFIFSNVGVCMLFVGYTIMGSFLFHAIENVEDGFKNVAVEGERNETIEYLWNITQTYNNLDYDSWNDSTSEKVKQYQVYMIAAIGRGYDGSDDPSTYDPWSFEGGFLYSLTVITTIGYGHLAPKTVLGKVMTIVYAIFGMPVFLLYMANMGDILAKSLKWTYARVCICRQPPPPETDQKYHTSAVWRSAAAILSPMDPQFGVPEEDSGGDLVDGDPLDGGMRGRRLPPGGEYMGEQVSIGSGGSLRSPSEKTEDVTSVNIPITVSLVILFALLYGGTEMFQTFENWDPLTSFYFCFISLTTIGFGDIVPGSSISSENKINFIYCSLYLMLGLALLSMCFNLMQEEVVHKVTTCVKSVTFFKRRQANT